MRYARPRSDRAALAVWAGSRVLVLYAAVVALGGVGALGSLRGWLHWDAALLVEIAKYGYGGDPAEQPDAGLPGFLPGLPLLLRAVHLALPNWALTGLLISLVASAVAAVALVRLGDLEGPQGTGWRAAAFLLISPWAVFLAAGYTEATFLAFALPAWLQARGGRWVSAGVLAALAATVRITALFLAAALLVMYLTRMAKVWRRRRAAARYGGDAAGKVVPAPVTRRPLLSLGALLLPVLPLLGYATYLQARTGDWLAWLHAQEAGWGRMFTLPWDSFLTTWHAAVSGQFTVAFRGELVAAAIGVALCAYLIVRRRWAELCYVGLQVGALMTSAYYLSITRSTLLWWPLWLALGRAAARHWWILAVYVAFSAPLMAWYTARFIHGAWAG